MAEIRVTRRIPSPHRGPVSHRRRWAGVIALILLAGLGIAYRLLTDEARLRSYAERWLAQFTGGEAHVDSVDFDPFTGLTLSGVTLAIPPAAGFDPSDGSLEARTIFRSSALFLRLQPFSLLAGRLVVPEIVASDPELTLVRRTSDGLGNWQCLLRRRSGGGGGKLPRLPVLRLRNARIMQFQLGPAGRSGGAAQTIWADAQPLRDRPHVYDLKLSKVLVGDDSRLLQGDPGRLQIDVATRAVSGSLPSMSIDELLFAAPPEVTRWLTLLDIRGNLRPESIVYDGNTETKATLRLRDASLAIPIDADEERLPPASRYVQFSGLTGEFGVDGNNVSVNLQGRFRDHPLKLKGRLWLGPQGRAGGLDAVGLEFTLSGDGVLLPRDDAADPAEVRFVKRWRQLRNFVRDFDGRGPVDLTARLQKSPGEGIRFVDATMTLKGNSGRYLHFPYWLEFMTGHVYFRPDGSEDIELTGRHGDAVIKITGWEGGFKSQAGDLRIHAANAVLDDDLKGCLEESDQALCRRFNLQARMNIDAHLTRKDAPPRTPNNPWNTRIDITFLDGGVNFEGFPYPLERLGGRMRIASGGFDLQDVTGVRGAARAQVSGRVEWTGEGDPKFELELGASNVPLDAVLAAALPPEVRESYVGMDPAGSLDLSGRIVSHPTQPRLEYRLDASLRGVDLTAPSSQARLTGTDAQLTLTPDEIAIRSARGNFGNSELRIDGSLSAQPTLPRFSLHLCSDRLALDEKLRGILPDAWQSTWKSLKPAGHVKLDVRCRRGIAFDGPTSSAAGASRPASQPTTQPDARPADLDFLATVEPLDAGATYAGLPLALEQINGKVVISPDKVTLEGLSAKHDATSLSVSGEVLPRPGGTRAELALSAAHLQLNEPLRQALPARLRQQWTEVKPSGEMDLEFRKLVIDSPHGGTATWEFEGNAAMRNFAMSVGPQLSGVFGTIEAAGKVGADLSIEGRTALSRVDVDGRRLAGAIADLRRDPGSSLLRVENMFAHLYGGTVVGYCQVDYGSEVPAYSVSLDIRDVSLDRFLNAEPSPGSKPIQAKGLLSAKLSLSGESDKPATRRGGGSIAIREAQVFKIPLLLAILQVIHLTVDDNAFHDATATFALEGAELVLSEIDMRGNALSLVGAGRVDTPTQKLDLTLLIGSPWRLPRLALLSDVVDSIAREFMEVHVGGTLSKPTFRGEAVRSLGKTLEDFANLRVHKK